MFNLKQLSTKILIEKFFSLFKVSNHVLGLVISINSVNNFKIESQSCTSAAFNDNFSKFCIQLQCPIRLFIHLYCASVQFSDQLMKLCEWQVSKVTTVIFYYNLDLQASLVANCQDGISSSFPAAVVTLLTTPSPGNRMFIELALPFSSTQLENKQNQ